MDSPKYRKYLITRSSELFFKEEQTKVGTLFLKNPDNPFRPMRIIGLGFTASAIWSWKNVYRIHMSDPAAANVSDDSGVYASAFSRLANTNGKMMIEGPPRGPQGRFYELHEQFKDNKNPDFKVFLIQIYAAEKAGLVTHDFIEKQRLELGPLFPQTYEGSFIAGVGNVFPPALVDQCIILGDENLLLTINQKTYHPCGVDFGYNISKCVIVVGEWEPEKKLLRIVHVDDFGDTPPTPSQVANEMFDIYIRYGQNTHFFIDGSNRGSVNEAKVKFGERTVWESADFSKRDRIHPINFGSEHKQLLREMYIQATKGMLAVPSV